MASRILIIDDDEDFRVALNDRLSRKGYEIYEAGSSAQALATIKKCGIDLILLDLQLGDEDGLDLLDQLKKVEDTFEVIMITGYGSIQAAVEAMRRGVGDFIQKDYGLSDLEARIEKVLELFQLKLQRQRQNDKDSKTIIGKNPIFTECLGNARRLAKTDTTVLITGETGTGKEVFARHIHYSGLRAEKPFVVINCANLSENLLEDDLFGHEPGAYTDAVKQRRGKVALAEKGTLFLDEIGEVPLGLQSKLLRFIETKTYSRVGSDRDCKADVRIITATNRDLKLAIEKKIFREDLYYRLNIFPILLPSIRTRRDDIKLYVNHFLQDLTHSSPLSDFSISEEAMMLLEEYPWPGNIREIYNVIERAKILSKSGVITRDQLPIEIRNPQNNNGSQSSKKPTDLKSAMDNIQRETIEEALTITKGNQTEAANLLRISRTQLYRILKDYDEKGILVDKRIRTYPIAF